MVIDPFDIPCLPGSYLLSYHAREAFRVQIGRLGVFDGCPGWYLYVGSAFGPGGLRGRMNHHLHSTASPRWHIDYLRGVCRIVQIRYSVGVRLEHDWASTLCAGAGGSIPLPRFGASDCKCPAHLVHMPDLSYLIACPTFRVAGVIQIGLQ
jgi:Uri superfamily endonuclease